MMIAIDFGLDLEGGSLAAESWGEITCGPQALLELLELRLGLTHLPASQTSRAVVYRGLLEHLANQQPTFFGGSLKVDAVGVSNELLGWRDELILAGWDPRVEVDSSRIKQLAEVEASAMGSIPMGIGDRLARILTELAVGQAGIDRLSVREPEALGAFLNQRPPRRVLFSSPEVTDSETAGRNTPTSIENIN